VKKYKQDNELPSLVVEAANIVRRSITSMMKQLAKRDIVEFLYIEDDGTPVIGDLNNDTAFREGFLEDVNQYVYKELVNWSKIRHKEEYKKKKKCKKKKK